MEKQTEETKFCGQSHIPLNARIKIIANKYGDPEDSEMIGQTGTATHPFAFGETSAGWLGIRLDNNATMFGDRMNCHESEVEVIE